MKHTTKTLAAIVLSFAVGASYASITPVLVKEIDYSITNYTQTPIKLSVTRAQMINGVPVNFNEILNTQERTYKFSVINPSAKQTSEMDIEGVDFNNQSPVFKGEAQVNFPSNTYGCQSFTGYGVQCDGTQVGSVYHVGIGITKN